MIESGSFTVKQARQSVVVVATVLTAMAAWQQYRGRPQAALVLGSVVAVLIVAALIPRAAMFFHKWWMTLAGFLGYVNSRILLGVIFYLMVAPIGFIVRLSGHDPLARRRGIEPSYWRRREKTRQSREDYERAF